MHLKDLGQLVAEEIAKAGGVAKEFNTIAIDDGIAMGHDGMLYSLPSRELIADSVEHMVNAHCADALVCISNCDKITPGMLMGAMRLNIPAVFAIEIDIPERVLRANVSDRELARRRERMEEKGYAAWKLAARDRKVSKALQAYAAMATNAARGAVRDVTQIQSRAVPERVGSSR